MNNRASLTPVQGTLTVHLLHQLPTVGKGQ
jgi:hypothetical protein